MQQKRTLLGTSIALLGLIFAGSGSSQLHAVDDGSGSAKTKAPANRLAKETSAYLLMHAHNPVDWFPWGPEAFEKAKKENKLIFLSVGYSSCYWCHVMERKVFMNEAIAKILNQNFVCIKVDREERPDIDDIYMTALQVYYQATGAPSSGGWPLSMFLTPEGKPIAGGTYFPPEKTEGSQGFPDVMESLEKIWKTDRDQAVANADIIANETRRLMQPKPALKTVEINDRLIDVVFVATGSTFDPDFGGVDFNFNRPDGPKFPTPAKLAFIQRYIQQDTNPEVARLLELTLSQIACGGIRDHVGGGFHRYSVDRKWDVPHFEKMLYDQAQLADLYVTAHQRKANPFYKQVAEETFEFIRREMTSPEGGFYSSIDAETNGIEGEFYVWESTEIDRILGSSAAAFKDAYRVRDLSDFEHGNVLRLSRKKLPKPDSSDAIVANGNSEVTQRDEFTDARLKLLAVRNKRKSPVRDEKILTCWNALMIAAYARAAEPLGHPEYLKTAEKAANFVLTKLRDPKGQLLHSYASGSSRQYAYLDDYAFLVDSLLALHDASNDVKWLKAAKQLQDVQLRLFLDTTNGGFYFTSHEHEELLTRTKNCYDGVLPAGNSMSARNLIKLAKHTGNSAYLDEARATIEAFAGNIEQAPRGFSGLALAAADLIQAEGGVRTADAKDVEENVITVAGVDNKDNPNEPLVVGAEEKKPANDKKEENVKGRAYLSLEKLPAGGKCQIVVLLDVKEGWHVNANPPSRDFLIPTSIEFKSKGQVELTNIQYPNGEDFTFKGEDKPIQVYEGQVAIRGELKVPEKAAGMTDEMEITIKYQACNADGCQPPKKIYLAGKLAVAKAGEANKSVNAKLFTNKAKGAK